MIKIKSFKIDTQRVTTICSRCGTDYKEYVPNIVKAGTTALVCPKCLVVFCACCGYSTPVMGRGRGNKLQYSESLGAITCTECNVKDLRDMFTIEDLCTLSGGGLDDQFR